jgi:transposase
MTLFTLLYQPFSDRRLESPLLYNIREDTNTAIDFASVIEALLEEKYLVPGTFLIMDNAAVHNDNPQTERVFDRLKEEGIWVRRLPTYSPELNPCELVFAFLKNTLRTAPRRQEVDGRLVDIPFEDRLKAVLKTVSRETVSKFYDKCKRAECHRK